MILRLCRNSKLRSKPYMTIELTNVSDTYLETSQTSIIEFLCENS